MSSGVEFPDRPSTPVRVAKACIGPVGDGSCSTRLRARVPSFDNRQEKYGVRCADCGRVNHVDWRHALDGGEEA